MQTPQQTTLLDLVQAVSAYAQSDEEIVATVAALINSGQVRLCGTFAGARIDLRAARPSSPTGEHIQNRHVEKRLQSAWTTLQTPSIWARRLLCMQSAHTLPCRSLPLRKPLNFP
jgi:hypothetical protein